MLKLNFWHFGDNGKFLEPSYIEHYNQKWVFTHFLSKTRFLTHGQLVANLPSISNLICIFLESYQLFEIK